MRKAKRQPLTPERQQLVTDYLAACACPSALVQRRYPKLMRQVWATAAEDDLDSACLYGLVVAAAKYDFGRGIAFSTYALPWMRQSVQRMLVYGHVRDWHRRGETGVAALSHLTNENTEGRDWIYDPPDTRGADAGRAAEAEETRAVVHQAVRAAVRDETDAAMLALHYGLGGGERRKLWEIGDAYGVCRERVRQRVTRAMAQMRRYLEARV